MNGPTAFARTIRALEADSFRRSNLILLLTLGLLAAWTAWFLNAAVPQYETTSAVRVEPNRIVATFPARVLDHVRPGQAATVTVGGAAMPARVSAIGVEATHGEVRAVLLPQTESPLANSSGQPAEAAVEIERISPAQFVLRAIGRREQ